MRPTLLLVVIFSIIVQNTVSEKNETIDSTPLPIDEAENPSPLLPGDLDIGDGTLPSVVCNKSFCSNYFKHLKGRCEPIYENSCCPLAFDCSNEIKPKDKSVCRLNGATYLPDQEVNTGNPCMKCRCLMTPDNETELSCFNIEPPSIFHGPDFLLESEQCLHINVLGQCTKEKICSKEEIDAIKKKAKCPYMGKVYDYGEEFQVDDCTYCVCNDDWTGDTRNTKSCNVLQCNFEMESDNYDSGCEPIYMESGSCCPIESICPDEIKSITRITKDEVCNDELNIGTGNESIPSFYFNKNSNLCEHFFYKGSGGNRNRFTSFGRCMVKCEDGYSTCDLEPVTGVCLAHFTKFFFNKTSGNCEPFLYGGCGGNTNNFRTMEECTAQCKQPKESAMCVYNGQEFNKGEQLLLQTKYDRPCIQVHCIAPPHLTFIHKTCPEPPEDPNCEAIYQRGQCCPSYKCPKKEKKICLSKRFFQLQIANGCTAEYELDDVEEFCPIRFTCPDQPPVHESQCYVNGKVYKVNDTIENGPNCKQCYCTDKKGLGPVVECLGTPCSSHGNLNTNDIQLCYFSFNDTDSCCPNARCERREEIARCTYNDQTFYDGQIIPSDRDPCTICHCNKDWAGIDGPTCVKKDCKLELQRDRFLKQCLPVYLQNSCCPVNWICPSTNKLPVDADLREKCYFNKTGYSQGKDLDYPHRSNCIKCKCIAPPHFTCVEEQCPPPPNPEKGFRCQPQRITGGCCPTYNCTIPIKDPCFKMRCKEGEMCVRVVENCPVKPCHDQPKCVPIDHKPCDDYNCSSAEVCIVHTFPCESKTNCPVRATCLPRDPCEDSKLQCGEGKVCKNLIPSCSLSPCPLVATCVDDDPCKDACKLNQRCIATKDVCKVPPCKMKANCIDLSCPTPACAADSEFRPFGFGKGNCPFCQKIF